MSNQRPYKKGMRTVRDPSGQLIIDQEEDNLSDKEMYARNVPAIGNELIDNQLFTRQNITQLS